MSNILLFHAFFYINDLEGSKIFYRDLLGCDLKDSNATSFTINFFGHGVSFEYLPDFTLGQRLTCTAQDVDSRQYVPSMHWGINLDSKEHFDLLVTRLQQAEVEFVVPCTSYNDGKANEQRLFFVKDPTGYLLEFRYMSRAFTLQDLEEWDQRSIGHERRYL